MENECLVSGRDMIGHVAADNSSTGCHMRCAKIVLTVINLNFNCFVFRKNTMGLRF